MAQMERVIRGIPIWLLQEYLEELGGEIQKDGSVAGNDWTATMTELENYERGSFDVGQTRLVIEGDELVLDELEDGLKIRLLRGGGP